MTVMKKRTNLFKRTGAVNNLPPCRVIPIVQQTGNNATKPSPTGLWWFLDRVTPEERRAVNDAANGQELVAVIHALYARHPRLAGEALNH